MPIDQPVNGTHSSNGAVAPRQQRKMLFRAWLGLNDVLEYYNIAMAGNGRPEVVNRRADIIAALRSVEEEIGLTQSIPRRVR